MDIGIYQQYWSTWFPYLIAFMMVVLAILVLLLYLICRQLKAFHSSDFVAAWTALVEKMEEPQLRSGRGFLRFLQTEAGGTKVIPRSEWNQMFEAWKDRRTSDQWYLEDLDTETDPKRRLSRIAQIAKDAYDQFDLAGILVLHSKIPNLLGVFIAEYQDNIIACWEQGSCFFKDRVVEMRRQGRGDVREELYHCFSVVYVLAKRRREVAPELYPHYTWIDRWKLHQSGSAIAREAKGERDKLIREALDEASRREEE